MKVVVISMKDAHERRTAIARQLDATGLDYHILDAVDGSVGHEGLFDAFDAERFLLETGRRAVAGEIGCYASHVAVWRICSASGQPVVVLEDDAHLSDKFAAAVSQCERLIDGCGFIRLQTETRGRKRLVLRADEDFSLYRYTRVPHSAAGYAINSAVAAEFCRQSTVMAAPVDVFLKNFWEHGQPMYGLVPYPVDESERSLESMIGCRPKAGKTLGQRFRRLFGKLRSYVRRVQVSRKTDFYWSGD